MEKRIFFHQRADGVDDADFAARERAAHDALAAGGTRCAVDLALADQSAMDRAGMKARPLVWHAASLRWGDASGDDDVESALASAVAASAGWRVEETIAWDYDPARTSGGAGEGRYWPAGEATPGVKFLSLVAKPEDMPLDAFRARYANHAHVAKEHHGGCWRYVQNIVIEPVTLAPGKTIHAVSELWFHSVDDYVDRLYTRRPESPEAVAEDTKGFIDFRNTTSMLVQETLLGG
jgi:hypothetical protein